MFISFRMTIGSFVEDVHASLHRLSQLGAEVVSRHPERRAAVSEHLIDTLRRQLVATNNLRASCEEHLANVNRVKDFALQVCP